MFPNSPKRDQPWQRRAMDKVDSTLSKIPFEWRLPRSVLYQASSRSDITGEFIQSLLTPSDAATTALEAADLVSRMASRELSAETVTKAFCKRAAFAHQLTNCLHEIFFDQAIERARELDNHLESTGAPVGPLHGLPISLKDQFHVKGVETTMGYVGWIGTFEGKVGTGKEKNTNSAIVDDLLSLGAVLYCKTSLPQTLMLGETHNNIIGHTMNPNNQQLSCGGSSGGEGALIALRGSVLGLGTDIGGSVRIPSSFCGIIGIKPSFSRFSYKDVANTMPGQLSVASSVGFMSTSFSSLRLTMQSIISTKPWLRDPSLCPLPWRSEQELSLSSAPGLCFGLFSCDGMVSPHPPVARAILMLKTALEKAGHSIVPWNPQPNHETGAGIYAKYLDSDGGADIFNQLELSGEPLIPEKMRVMGIQRAEPLSLLEYQELEVQLKSYREAYQEYWNSTAAITGTGRPVDAIIMPVSSHAAVIPGKYHHYAYSLVVNLLDYTSITIPVTKASKAVDPVDKMYQPLNDKDRINWKAYDANVYDGAPVGLQIVGQRFQEEYILSIAEIAHAALQGSQGDKVATVDS